MKKVYGYEGKEYNSLYELRRAIPNVSLPLSPQETDLFALGVTISEVAEKKEEQTLEERKESKANEIHILSEQKVQAMQQGYTLGELNTFEQQYAGAAEILANGVADDVSLMSKDAQFVVGLASGRTAVSGVEITPEELAQKIVANYVAAKEGMLQILSLQQGLEVRVRIAESVEELDSIEWPDSA